MDEAQIRNALYVFFITVIGGLGTYIFNVLKDVRRGRALSFDAQGEQVKNMAVIRQTMTDLLKRNGDLEDEVLNLRKLYDAVRSREIDLLFQIQVLREEIKDMKESK